MCEKTHQLTTIHWGYPVVIVFCLVIALYSSKWVLIETIGTANILSFKIIVCVKFVREEHSKFL